MSNEQYNYVIYYGYHNTVTIDTKYNINDMAENLDRTTHSVLWEVLINNPYITHLYIVSSYCSAKFAGIMYYCKQHDLPCTFMLGDTGETADTDKEYKKLSRARTKEFYDEQANEQTAERLRALVRTQKLLDFETINNNMAEFAEVYNERMAELDTEDSFVPLNPLNPMIATEALKEFALDWCRPYDIPINNPLDDKELFSVAINILWYIQCGVQPMVYVGGINYNTAEQLNFLRRACGIDGGPIRKEAQHA